MTRTAAAILVVAALPIAACGDSSTNGDTAMHQNTTENTATDPAGTDRTEPAVRVEDIAVNGTTLHVQRRGSGDPLLLIHGAGEDAGMLADQADAFASAGYEVITYDRRGTGRSGREDWPGGGAAQHATDAAALLDDIDVAPATVVGLSSGGVIALTMAAWHREQVARVVAWEPPAAGVLPGGAEATAAIMAPVDAHLAANPGDFVGAQAILFTAIAGFPVTTDDPDFAAARANAESTVRDDPAIVLAPFTAADLAGRDITVAVGSEPNELIAGATAVLAELTGTPTTVARGPHEVYFVDPTVLVDVVRTAEGT